MPQKINILQKIDPHYFWDIDVQQLDPQTSKRLIVERVFSLGKLDEMIALIHFYGWDEVLETLSGINYLDPKTLNFIAKVFDRPKNSFKCYTRTHSTRPHWNS